MGKLSKGVSILEKGIEVEGDITCKGTLVIKGKVKGTLRAERVVISDGGCVYAQARVNSMTVSGIFEGTLRAMDELVVLKKGNFSGKVMCKDLVVEAGGSLNADVTYLAAEGSDVHERFPFENEAVAAS